MGLLETGIFGTDLTTLKSIIVRILEEVNGKLSFGHPDTVLTSSSNGQLLNIEGSWVVLTLTSASGTATCTHNLDIPITTIGANNAKPANVRWLVFGAELGDKTGTNAAPASPGSFTVEFVRMVNGTITANAIDLLYFVTGPTPSATAPLTVSLFFVKAVN